jgi:hypothetical protein
MTDNFIFGDGLGLFNYYDEMVPPDQNPALVEDEPPQDGGLVFDFSFSKACLVSAANTIS